MIPTPQDFSDFITVFRDSLAKIKGENNIDKVIGGLPGVLDEDRKSLVYSPNLSDWVGKPVKNELTRISGSEVTLENDAALAALGEANFGAGKDFNIVAYLTVSTGVGGARIVDKKIDKKVFGFEPGHQIISIDTSDNFADLESLVSGAGLLKSYHKKAEDIDDKKIWDKVSKYLAIGLNNTIVHWSPDIVVLGGALINNGKISIDNLKSKLIKILKLY
jgi:predicted NBD/HSP70 family sugar kinase